MKTQLLRLLLGRQREVPEPPSNVTVVPQRKSDDQVLYELEPDRPYDHEVDGL